MKRPRLSGFGDEIDPDLSRQLEVLKANSVEHLELRAAWGVNVVELGPARLAQAAGLLQEFGVGVSAIGSPVGKSDIEGDFERELGRLRAALDAASKLETPLVRVFSFFIPEGRHGQHRDEVLRRMAALADEAQSHGCTLVHENETAIYGDTAERCLDLVEAVGSPALRTAFDPANFVQVGVDPLDAWRLLANSVVHFHVKDAVAPGEGGLMESVRLPGQGDGHLPKLLGELGRCGYDGFLTIEPHLLARLPQLSGAERFEAALTALRGILSQLD
jgi:sugar phosphate isomerase/epimerase